MWPSLQELTHLPRVVLVAALALILIVAPLLSAFAARRAAANPRGTKHGRYARTMLILWSLTALAVYALRLHGQDPSDVGLVPPREPLYYLAGLAVVAIALAGTLRRGAIEPSYAEKIRLIIPLSTADWLWFVPLACSAGLCEEFLYRGYALNVIAQLTGSVALGVVLSTMAFGLAHAYQGRAGVIGTTVLGLLFALIYLLTGSLWPCIIAHIAQDLLGGALLSRRIAALPPPAPPAESPPTLPATAESS